MSQVTFTFPCGKEMVQLIDHASVHRGIKYNGSRPIKAEIVGEVSREFINKNIFYVLHPYNRTLIHNGSILFEGDSEEVDLE